MDDPEFNFVPVDKLLSKVCYTPSLAINMDLTARKEYFASRAQLFDPTRTNPKVIHGNPVNSSDTVYFTGMHE